MSNTKIRLDDYEGEILELYEDGRLKPAPGKTDYQAIARTTFKKKLAEPDPSPNPPSKESL